MNAMTQTPGEMPKPVAERSDINIGLFADVHVALEARLGEAHMTVDGIMKVKPGTIVTLETGLADHVDLYLNEVLVARGEIVAVGEKYGVRVVEIAPQS